MSTGWPDDLAHAERCLATLERLSASGPEVLEGLDELAAAVDRGFNAARLAAGVHPDEPSRHDAIAWMGRFTELRERVAGSGKLRALLDDPSLDERHPAAARYRAFLLRRARMSGAALPDRARARIGELTAEIGALEQEFAANAEGDRRGIAIAEADAEGLPPDLVAALARDADGKLQVGTAPVERVAFMAYARSDALRRQLLEEFCNIGNPANAEVLPQLLRARHELARTLGYERWTDLALERSMAGSVDVVRDRLDRWTASVRPELERNRARLLAWHRREHPGAQHLEDWQWIRLQELVKQHEIGFDARELRQYLQPGPVLELALELCGTLFDVHFEPAQVLAWHPSVQGYRARTGGGDELGLLYLDLHPRPGKYSHSATVPIVTGVRGRQRAEAAIVANLPEGHWEHFDVVQLFHEIGHAVHFLLAAGDPWLELAGFETEEDFAEVPSQLLEEWAWREDVLGRATRRSDGAGPPTAMLRRLRDVRRLEDPARVQRMICFAALSLEYHACRDPITELEPLLRQVQDRHAPYPPIPGTRPDLGLMPLATEHAMHYAYSWSSAIARDFHAQIAADPRRSIAYAHQVLARTPSSSATELVRAFLGRDPSTHLLGAS